VKLEPIALRTHRTLPRQETQHHLEALLHPSAGGLRSEPEHLQIRGDAPSDPDPETDPPPGEVIEQDHPVESHQRMVETRLNHTSSEANLFGALGRRRDHDLG
jgi:hypothetical protein